MTNSFKCSKNVRLRKILENSSIGKNVIKKTGINIKDILNNFCLELPIEHISGASWIITWACDKIKIKPECFLDVEMFMKQAWYYSSASFIESPLRKYVGDELTKFELGIMVHKNLDQKRIASRSKRVRIPALHIWIEEELLEDDKIQAKQLWSNLPESSENNSEGFYRDGNKVHCLYSGNSLRFSGFRNNVKAVKEKIAHSGVRCNQM